MPRKSKTQKINTAPNQAYGVAGDQKQAMNVVPLPDTQIDPQMTTPAMPPAEAPEGTAEPSIFEMAMQELPPTMKAFSDPTSYPDQPLMTPPVIAGQGKAPNRVAAMLRSIGANSSNPQEFDALAALAERNGL